MTDSQTSTAHGAQGQPQRPPLGQPAATAADPSMEDILASIRRILSEDETQAEPQAGHAPASGEIDRDDVLVLDESMMAPDEAASFPASPTPPLSALPQTAPPPLASAAAPAPLPPAAAGASALLAPEAADAAANAMGTLIRTLADQPTGDPLTPLQVRSGGPTIEDIVREEIRPLLKAWLDANLPPLTERLVREEIRRLADRAAH